MKRVRVEAPYSVEDFRSTMAKTLELDISVEPYRALGVLAPQATVSVQCGLVVVTADSARILYDDTRSERHQRAQIFHEFAHLLCNHHTRYPLATLLRSGDHPLAEGLEPALLAAAFGQPTPGELGDGRESMEAEAELAGTKLAVRSRGPIEPHRSIARMLATWDARS